MKSLIGTYHEESEIDKLRLDLATAEMMLGSHQMQKIRDDNEIKRLKSQLRTQFGALELENLDLNATIKRMVKNDKRY